FRLGLFENPYVDLKTIKTKIFTEEHKATALEQARKGIVLQKNNGFLPLKNLSGKKIFITGPNANNMTTLGDWSSPQPEDNYVTIKEGLDNLAEKYNYSTEYYDCGQRSKWITDENISTAKSKAAQSDIVVLVLGENSYRHDWKNKTTGENIDRATLALSGNQLKLAKAIKDTGKPIVVVYVSGSPIAEPWLENNVKAVVNAWEPGAFGGQAVAEILTGEINPSGKLPLTIPRSVGQLQMVYNHKPTAYIHKYNTEKKVPLHPFGYGLSYSTFEFSEPKVSKTDFTGLEDTIDVEVTVKNTSEVDGEEVVQMYIRDNMSSYTRPVKELKGYKRVFVKAGETKTVTITVKAESLAMYDKDFNFVVEPGDFTIMTGNSSRDKDLKNTTITVKEKIVIDKNN
ncbi:MAG TPA: beta-glucosidase, partial [Flavobacteriaceae bacterium]|nr:beta-glucosidase [Flavobacteriaceae bacterium]